MDWRTLPFGTKPIAKQPSRLLNLPQELRDLILSFALTSPKPVVSFRLDDYQKQKYQEATLPPLTRVNRQIRKESLPIFFTCNDIVLHTEKTKSDDTQEWLKCMEKTHHLRLLNRVDIWIRYATLTNEASPSHGAIAIRMQRSKAEGRWIVLDEWKWITVTRQPSIVHRDAKFLIQTLRRMLRLDPLFDMSAEGWLGVRSDLRLCYVKEKMS